VKGRVGVAVLLAACAGAPSEPPLSELAPTAEISVEIWPGFASEPHPPGDRVEIVLDATRSMRAASLGGPPRIAAARAAAARLLEALPPQTPVGVHVLGAAPGAACGASQPWARGEAGPVSADLSGRLRALAPGSEASLAGALEGLLAGGSGSLAGARVVAFTDLGGECAGDLCAAGAALAAAGAEIDLVVVSGAPVPRCLAGLVAGGGPRAAAEAPPPAPAVRIETHPTWSAGPPRVLVRGRADGTPLAVPEGPVLVVIEMSAPALIGPMRLDAFTRTRVRVLDFPALDPPVREWRWDV
jgi:Ca-activated chloride channel family protein